MRGGCITYQYTCDEELYSILTQSVQELLTTQDTMGRISTYRVEREFHGWDLWCRKYVLLGLLHYWEVCKDPEFKETVIAAAQRHLDYILRHIGPNKLDITTTSEWWSGVNSSSILEPVVRMYNATGKQEYLDFAQYIIDCGGAHCENIFKQACDAKLYPHEYKVIKAYELMSCFEGLIEYYLVKGGDHWKAAVCDFAHKIAEAEISIIGCAGCMHEFFDHSAKTQTNIFYNGIMQETCVTVTWIKFCTRLLLLTGDAYYADQIELSVYNALYGTVNLNGNPQNGGLPFDSYSPLLYNHRARGIGGYQLMENGAFFYGCCAAIGAAGTGLFPNLHLLNEDGGIALSFYSQGTFTFSTPAGNRGQLTVTTNYPYEDRIQISMTLPEKEAFHLKLRIPGFCRWATLFIGEETSGISSPGYFTVSKEWPPETELLLELDMHPRHLREPSVLNEMHRTPHFAVCYGPLVLARDARLGDDAGKAVSFDPNCFSIDKTSDFGIGSQASFLVRVNKTTALKMVAYASAGATWDTDSMMECWLPLSVF